MPLKPQAANIHRFVKLREIRGDVLCCAHPLRKKAIVYRALIAVNSLNFSLMSEKEQEAILEGFRVVLLGLDSGTTTSIHIRIEPYDRAAYADQIRAAASPAAATFVEDHLSFVESLAASRALVQRRYYILLAADDADARQAGRKTPEELFAQARSQLERRCSALIEALERIGLTARRMQRTEIANYYRSCWHARAARMYPLSDNALGAAEHLVRPEGVRRLA
jgi:hypothetical protein